MSTKLNIEKKTVSHIVSSMFTNKNVYCNLNFEHITSLMTTNVSDNVLELALELMFKKEPYELVYPGDLVKLKPVRYYEGDKYEKDVLKDMGLLSDEGMIYAKVISDSNWSSSAEYNPLYSQLKIKVLFHDEDKNIRYEDISTSPLDLEKLYGKEHKNIITIINNKEKKEPNGKTITGVDPIAF